MLPSNYTFVAADSGVHTFTTIVLKTAGSQSVTATDTTTSSITGSASVTVSPAAASQLAFSQQPSSVPAGTAISPAVTVQALDAYNNLATNNSSLQVSMAMGANPGSGTLSGTTTATLSSGVATFSNLSINNTGTGYTLVASGNGVTSATSSAFNVTASTTVTQFSVSDTGQQHGRIDDQRHGLCLEFIGQRRRRLSRHGPLHQQRQSGRAAVELHLRGRRQRRAYLHHDRVEDGWQPKRHGH